ncbi:hypothetical protein HYN56_19905 [Flavobacterium crocinum]|uniref:Leucine-rich repeat domain-containing protein n=1 Tax=Flavobacterium crocinum TaxID=2183896 RepID=A0A2S1YQJ7_9FLAO|nr:hypothetical protein [Flavobacterium crocinum]AWK06367.1 hypothetical protein HYN56_19905 [Flavobacterium crocinum]
MKLKGIEKQFWWHFGQINDSKGIPEEISGISGVDNSDYNDEYFEILTGRIKIIHSIYLKETAVTDEGLKHISKIKQLKSLTVMKHPQITKDSLPYLNALVDLEYLDIWRTGIILEDLKALDQLKKLKEIYVSSVRELEDGSFSELDSDKILEHVIELEAVFPNCTFFVDFKKYP